jgi:N utilization substance protein A
LGAGINTVEKLGSMTPEDLEAIPEIGPAVVEKILIAVNSYYAQFDPPAPVVEETVSELEAAEVSAASDQAAPVLEAAPEIGPSEELSPVGHTDSPDHKGEFDTIKNSEEVS